MIRTHLYGGPFDRQRVWLNRCPLRLQIGDSIYHRVDDPDTGQPLGAYVLEKP